MRRGPTLARADLAAFVETHYHVVSRSGPELSVLCPVHDDRHASMRINVDKGVGFCHGCGVRGGVGTLARLVGAPVTVAAGEGTVAVVLAKLRRLDQPPTGSTVLAESTLTRYRLPTTYWTDPAPVGRGLTDDIVAMFDLGYDPIDGCAVVPVRDIVGRLLGVTRRYLDPQAATRYRDPKGFRKADHLFAAWLVARHESTTVVLTEGPIDCMKVWQAGHPALAQFGSRLCPHHLDVLLQLGIVKVVLMYDNDLAGRRALRQAIGWTYDRQERRWRYTAQTDLRRHFVVVRARFARQLQAVDPAAMSDDDIRRSISAATLVR